MAIIIVKIAGIDRTAEWQRTAETSWEDPLNGRGTGRIRFGDVVGGFVPSDGQAFEIIDGGVTAFAGILMEPDQHEPEKAGFVMFDCQLADYNILADRRTVGEDYDNIALELIVSGIVTDHMAGEGISLAGVETGPALTSNNPHIKATESFNALSDATGRPWYIDLDPVTGLTMNMHVRTSITAPAIVDGDMALMGTVKVREDRQKYRNEQILTGGTDEFPILVVSGRLAEIDARAIIEGTAGVYSDVQSFPEILNETVLLEKAGDLLDRFAKITKVVTLVTRTAGFRAGQSATVNFPNHSINNVVMLIDNVTARVVTLRTEAGDTQEIWYTLSCITGDPFGGWMEHFRKAPPVKGVLRFPNDPGLFRIDPKPGAVVHDPLPGPFDWFQAATSVPTLFPSSFGLTDDGTKLITLRFGGLVNTGGCSGGTFPGFGGSPACFANRQVILEGYNIGTDNVVSVAPDFGTSTDALNNGSNFKATICISPDGKFALIHHIDTATGHTYVYDIEANTFRGNVVSTMPENSNRSEPVWVGDVCYFMDSTGATLFMYDVSDPDNPTETTFTTSLTVGGSLVASPDGSVLYGAGGTVVVALDISTPLSPVEDTTLTISLQSSIDINDDGDHLVLCRRNDANDLRVQPINMTVNATNITLGTVSLVPFASSVFNGLGAVWRGATAMFWSQVPASPVNSLEAVHIDLTDPDAATLIETFAYNHGLGSNEGPFRNQAAAKVYFFFGGVTQQITFGEASFDVPVPLTIDCPLRVGFGGTGIANYLQGDIIFADRKLPDTNRGFGELTRLAIGEPFEVLTVSGFGSAGEPRWLPLPASSDAGELLFTTTDVLAASGVGLADVTELEATVESGTTYYFRADLFYDADVDLGHRWAIGGTAAGDVIYQIRILDDDTGDYNVIVSGRKSALGESAGVAPSGAVRGYTEISGSIDVTADGTIVPRFGIF